MPAKNRQKTFSATLERMPSKLGWTIIRVPFDIASVWGKHGNVRVKGVINSFAFSTSLFPTRNGTHFMLVSKKMQKGGRVQPGVSARFALQPDKAKRGVARSPELERVFKQSKRLTKFYESFSPGMRKYIAAWVQEPKSQEARER